VQPLWPDCELYVPCGQAWQLEEEPAPVLGLYVPAGHCAHASLCDTPPLFTPYVPTAHEPSQGWFCPTLLSKVPEGQLRQLEADAPPELLEYLPATQLVQVADELAPVADDHVPAGQLAHAALCVCAPLVTPYVPAGHWPSQGLF